MPTTDDRVERVAQLLDEWWARNQGCDLKTWLADHRVVALAPGEVVVPREPSEAMIYAMSEANVPRNFSSGKELLRAMWRAAIEREEEKP